MKDVSMARVLAVLALGAWCCIFWSYPVTVFLAGSISCLTLPLYRWLRARMSRFKSTAILCGRTESLPDTSLYHRNGVDYAAGSKRYPQAECMEGLRVGDFTGADGVS